MVEQSAMQCGAPVDFVLAGECKQAEKDEQLRGFSLPSPFEE